MASPEVATSLCNCHMQNGARLLQQMTLPCGPGTASGLHLQRVESWKRAKIYSFVRVAGEK